MTNKEIKEEIEIIKKKGAEICKSKKSARKFLFSLGMYTKSGKLKKRFK